MWNYNILTHEYANRDIECCFSCPVPQSNCKFCRLQWFVFNVQKNEMNSFRYKCARNWFASGIFPRHSNWRGEKIKRKTKNQNYKFDSSLKIFNFYWKLCGFSLISWSQFADESSVVYTQYTNEYQQAAMPSRNELYTEWFIIDFWINFVNS